MAKLFCLWKICAGYLGDEHFLVLSRHVSLDKQIYKKVQYLVKCFWGIA